MRYEIFTANLQKIEDLNRLNPHTIYSHLTQWADLTEEEFTNMHGMGAPDNICQFLTPPPELSPTAKPKESLDYVALGATVAVKNQGKCASCWAHASTAVIEARLKLDTGNTSSSLSVQYLMDCDKARVCKGCCGGLPERTLQWEASAPGIASEKQYPYTSGSGTDPTKGKCNHTVPLVAKLTGFGHLGGDEVSMMAGMTQYGVFSVSMDSRPLQFYKRGVIMVPNHMNSTVCDAVSGGNHAVAMVGYGTDGETAYWKVRNSYGAAFGEQGYFRIQRFSTDDAAPCGMSECVIAGTHAAWK
jgi:C1A family cysteine protease